MRPLVSVIISCKNEEAHIERLLKSIANQEYRQIEIIVVDNFSTDSTPKITKKYTKHIFSRGPERSPQRNFGALQSRGKYLLFLDADMELPPQIINECVEIISKQRASAIIIPETNMDTNFFSRIKRLEKKLYENESLIEAPRFFLKTAFLAVGGYNEKLIAGEDWDLASRIRKYALVTRIKTPLLHFENSFVRELMHKLYYAKLINKYKSVQSADFIRQSGAARLQLFWRKRNILLSDPLAAVGLFFVKATQYLLFRTITFFL